ncbi:hypothetical protein ACLKA6_000086 [Drosophila palustris]
MEMANNRLAFRTATGTPEEASAARDKTFTYQDRRRAAFILSHTNSSSDNSPEEENQIKWAKSVLPNFQPAKAGKRQRSVEEHEPQAKRTRTLPSHRSFSDFARDRILIGVLDRGSRDGQVPRDRWRLVENELQDRFLQILETNGGLPPICEDAGWHQGSVKAIACQDVRSATLYKMAVGSLGELYPGARLEAVNWNQVPSKLRARAWVSEKPAEPDRILRLLQVCNPHLPTANWKVAKVEDAVGLSRQIILTLDEESAGMILKSDGLVTYGFKKVAIRIYKSDAKGRQIGAEKHLNLAVDKAGAPEDDILDGYVSEESNLARGLRSIVVDDDDDDDVLSGCESDSDVTVVED